VTLIGVPKARTFVAQIVERETGDTRRERKYNIKWNDFGLWMNKRTTSSARYCGRWMLVLKIGVGELCGF
jgi:hypothetical protein